MSNFLLFVLLLACLSPSICSNWAQNVGERAQKTATPYIPDQWQRSRASSTRPLFSARYGHKIVVLNEATPRSYLTDEENSQRAKDSEPILVLLGGDDRLPRDAKNSSSSE
jgi:hypothetical protein